MKSTKKNITLKKKISNYDIYNVLLTEVLNELQVTDKVDVAIIRALNVFFTEISVVVKFMLVDRFAPSVAKKKKTKVSTKRSSLSRDMVVFLDESKLLKKIPAKPTTLDPLAVIKAMKLLETFMLRRSYSTNLDNLELGQLTLNITALLDNLPKLLLDVDSIIDTKAKKKVLDCIFSMIIIYRQFKVKSIPDISTITAPYSGTRSIESLLNKEFSLKNITEWLCTLGLDIEELQAFSRLSIYSGNASSPNGGASASNLYKDVAAVGKDTLLYDAIIKMAKHFRGANEFTLLLETLSLNVKLDKDFVKDAIHSRLFHFTAPGGKARIIANVDWVTQTALSAIHFTLFKLLSCLTSDCTFNHKDGIKLYDDKEIGTKHNFYSIDLSAATDRMPRTLQAALISAIWSHLGFDGADIAVQWLTIVDREYDTTKSKLSGTNVRYAVGQGMGLFSSWVALAITHHYIANFICKIPMSNYKLVGDDLLIKGTRAQFDAYINIMTEIGLKVNLNKTIISENTKSHNIEFARNYIISGLSITPLPFGQLFAWTSNTCPLETSISIIVDVWTADTVARIIEQLCDAPTLKLVELIYYLHIKKGIIWSQLPWLDICKQDNAFMWVSEANFKKINAIITSDVNVSMPAIPVGLNTVSFLNSLKSQCTMRTVEDILRSKKFSESIILLQYADDELTLAANLFYERLISATTITYDVDNIGTPLLSKRERNLLSDVLKEYNKKPRVSKKKPVSKPE